MSGHEDVGDWMRRYEQAWASNRPEDIQGLFEEDGEYRFHPWDEPARGHDAIVAAWLDAADSPDDHTFSWEVVAVDGPTAVVEGRTEYSDGDVYVNLWVIRFGTGGRAASFTEWYMEPPSGEDE